MPDTTSRPTSQAAASDSGLGLDAHAERVYRLLLSRRRWNRADIARESGVAGARLTALLDQLCASGLVRHSQDVPDALRAVEPAIGLPGLAAIAIQSGDGRHKVAAAAVKRFVALHEASDRRFEVDGELAATDDACAVVERLVAQGRNSITFLVPHYVADGPQFSRPVVEAALRRGLTIRTVWGGRVSGQIGAWEHGERLGAAGFAPRVVAHVPVSAVVVDDDVAVVMPGAARPRVLRSAEQVRSLVEVAERLVDSGAVIKALTPPAPTVERVPRCQLVLRLLAEGYTDDAMARKLGCSVRTIRNEVAAAMAALNARSRFQAGVCAMQAGLL